MIIGRVSVGKSQGYQGSGGIKCSEGKSKRMHYIHDWNCQRTNFTLKDSASHLKYWLKVYVSQQKV